MLIVRSVAFNCLFYLNLILHVIGAIPTYALPRRAFMAMAKSWGYTSGWLLRVVAGTSVELRGLDKIPPGALLVAAKHQSVWETFMLLTLFDDPAYVFKHELQWIPVFGWYAWKSRIIFPEGTRTAPGAPPVYKYGAAQLYAACGVPCLPVALNSGLYWPRRKFLRYPGTIVLEVLDPIPPGLSRAEFADRLEREIEGAVARLTAEAAKDLHSARAVEIVTP